MTLISGTFCGECVVCSTNAIRIEMSEKMIPVVEAEIFPSLIKTTVDVSKCDPACDLTCQKACLTVDGGMTCC